jgi:hypothetical protein
LFIYLYNITFVEIKQVASLFFFSKNRNYRFFLKVQQSPLLKGYACFLLFLRCFSLPDYNMNGEQGKGKREKEVKNEV